MENICLFFRRKSILPSMYALLLFPACYLCITAMLSASSFNVLLASRVDNIASIIARHLTEKRMTPLAKAMWNFLHYSRDYFLPKL